MADDQEFGADFGRARSRTGSVVAVVGRPNVGKSTLVNRILGRRAAVVEDVPGVTRDRVAYDATWNGRRFTVVDTGGWEPSARGLAAAVAEQAQIAVELADAVLFVIDTTVGATDADEAVARVLQRSGRPVVLAANKVDDVRLEAEAAALWSLGLGEPYTGLGAARTGQRRPARRRARRAARAGAAAAGGRGGRPAPGRAAGPAERREVLAAEQARRRAAFGGRRGRRAPPAIPVDSLVPLGGETWRFVDTAGLRRRVREAAGAEYYSSLRTETALRSAEVALVLLDASEPLSEQDQRILSMADRSGPGDRHRVQQVGPGRRGPSLRPRPRDRPRPRPYPVGAAGQRLGAHRTVGGQARRQPIRTALAGWETRIPTGRLNSWLGEVVAATPPPSRGGKIPKVLFATQADIRPPRFVVFSSGFLEAGYRRFLERRLREEFGFAGTPIEVSVRVRGKDKRER